MRRSKSHRTWLGVAAAVSLLWACADSFDPSRIGTDDPGGGEPPAPSSGEPAPEADAGVDNGSVTDPFAAGVTYFTDITSAPATAAHAAADAAAPRDQPDCLSCHADGAAGAQTKFAIGGLTFESRGDGGGGPPCAACEILFVDSVGHRVKAVTASDGTFALTPEEYGPVSPGTHVGIRRGGVATLMTLQENVEQNGTLRSCNSTSCHGPGGAEGVIVLTGN